MVSGPVCSAFLVRFAKHLALLLSLLIVGRADQRVEVSQTTLLALAVGSALLHLIGRALQPRGPRTNLVQHDPRAPEA